MILLEDLGLFMGGGDVMKQAAFDVCALSSWINLCRVLMYLRVEFGIGQQRAIM